MTSRSDTCPPGFQEVLAALEALKASEPEATDLRKVERIEVTIPAEIRTSDGKPIAIRLEWHCLFGSKSLYQRWRLGEVCEVAGFCVDGAWGGGCEYVETGPRCWGSWGQGIR